MYYEDNFAPDEHWDLAFASRGACVCQSHALWTNSHMVAPRSVQQNNLFKKPIIWWLCYSHMNFKMKDVGNIESYRGTADGFFFLIEVNTFMTLFVFGGLPLFDCTLCGLGGSSELFSLRSDVSLGDFTRRIDSGFWSASSLSRVGGPANVFRSSSTAFSKFVPRLRTILIFSIVTKHRRSCGPYSSFCKSKMRPNI